MRAYARQVAIVMLVALAASCSPGNSSCRGPALAATSPGSGSETTAATARPQAAIRTVPDSSVEGTLMDLDKVYQDESHCLTAADMRGGQDTGISCFCRDAIADARYLYFTCIRSRKDRNLNGAFLTLQDDIRQRCGRSYDAFGVATSESWKRNGPEVVRTYPSEEVISRIDPEKRRGRVVGRWVPFTVQLIYRDDQGHVTRTENYSSRELVPVLK